MHDLRSDTVTRPTPAMREAMATAEVGDDVFGEDPTVAALEAEVASLLGKAAAVFVPSGTMGNQVCLGALAGPGEEIIAEASAHVLLNEAGAAARLWGCQITTVTGRRGLPAPEDVQAVIRTPDIHHPRSSVLSLENTHNYAGGAVLPLPAVTRLAAVAHEQGLSVHMDGARLFNAVVASGIPAARWVADVDMVSVCLSKGLGAPAGSVVAGSAAHIATARRLRKLLGGGMRQAGVLAAAGRLALAEGPAALSADHRRARLLAEALATCGGCEVDPADVETNIVFVTTRRDAGEVQRLLEGRGVFTFALGPRRLRFVFHRDAGDDTLDAAVRACRAVLG